ncbi:MAG: LacI family DNA-binding transcriptional regulator [Bacteroidetes bacterium]|nr:LacI family DNA-binding transcriptional regulator [Bacteroidota bacterium]
MDKILLSFTVQIMGQNATLKKISAQLNLSISTVSRALKNHPDISENTKRKVKELAALMEYEPNSYAINLRTNKSRVLGLIVPDISNMFNDSFIAAAETDARKSGYSLMILQSANDPQQEAENLKLCKHYRVDGILISQSAGSFSTELVNKYQEAGIPILFFDRVPESGNFDTVCMADEEAATIAAHTIITYKKKNVLALFGDPELSITKKRMEAFSRILEKHKNIETDIRYCINSDEAKVHTTSALKNTRPDHIFCMSDEILIGVMKALHQTKLRIPEDISILAMSNGFIPGLFKPEISYIETSGYELGKLAMKRMLENMDNKSAARAILLPARLVEGGSL